MQEEYGDCPPLERVLKLSYISNKLYTKTTHWVFFFWFKMSEVAVLNGFLSLNGRIVLITTKNILKFKWCFNYSTDSILWIKFFLKISKHQKIVKLNWNYFSKKSLYGEEFCSWRDICKLWFSITIFLVKFKILKFHHKSGSTQAFFWV